MFIPDPGSRFLSIPDPGSKNSNKKEGWKKISCHTFFCSHKFHKIEHYLIFEILKEKNLGQFSKNSRTFYSNNCHYALKNMGLGSGIRDSGSGKNLFWIPDPGVKKAPDPGSGSATLIIGHHRPKFLTFFIDHNHYKRNKVTYIFTFLWGQHSLR